MHIKKITQKNSKTGKQYATYRLAESYRNAEGKVRHRIILNLGSHFELPREQWKLLADRVEEITRGQQTIVQASDELENLAQSIAKRVVQRFSDNSENIDSTKSKKTLAKDYQSVDLNSLEYQNVMQIGAEHVGWEIAKRLELDKLFEELKFNRVQVNTALSSIIGRLVAPGSERSTHKYLQTKSSLDELLGYDAQKLSLNQMYQISDKLEKNKSDIESRLFKREKELFQLQEVITLYDLTNTYFEGKAQGVEKAAYGRSKEKRYDCPLVTLALVLDSSGFPKKSEVLEGNVSEPKTLQNIIGKLEGETKPTIVMDAGIATQENINWLRENNYTYIVVSRKQKEIQFNDSDQVIIKHKKEYLIKAQLKNNPKTQELELYCHSELKAKKESAIQDKCVLRFEEELQKLNDGLKKKKTVKLYQKIIMRIGRLKEKYKRVAGLYDVKVVPDEENKNAIAITWEQQKENRKTPGIYCLRSNCKKLNEQELWDIYIMLTDLEAAFRCLKSELGLRPIYHQITSRVDSHIFISVIAYHLLHTIRYQLKAKGIHESWSTIREVLSTHCRITSVFKTQGGKTIHIRKSSQPNPQQAEIYKALEIPKIPGKTEKSIF